MTYSSLLSFIAALFCGSLAAFVFLKDRRSLVNWAFAAGMLFLAAEETLTGLSFQTILTAEVLRWERLRFLGTALLTGSLLVFSLGFARANYKGYLRKWLWLILMAFAFPLALVILFEGSFFKEQPVLDPSSGWLLHLAWPGYLFHILLLFSSILILVNLESTLRASSGAIRWQIKFMVLGIAAIFAIRIFLCSQSLLFYSVNLSMEALNAAVIIVANFLIVLSLLRSRILKVDVYLSETLLHKSLTVLIAGAYLFSVGILAKVVSYFNGSHPFFLEALFVFFAFLGLTIILLSNQLRQQVKRFVYLHLRRPKHDYRSIWTSFTEKTASLFGFKEICAAITRIVADTFGVSSATIWLVDEAEEHLLLGGSTVFSEAQAQTLKIAGEKSESIIRGLKNESNPVDLEQSELNWVKEFKQSKADVIREAQVRYCVPLSAGQRLLGVITINDRVTKESFSTEDLDLLKTIADQAAASILNLKVSERIKQAKEMEAIQTMSSFFVHDLKNLASKLSMTMQNLPIHFDNQEFRNDAVRTIGDTVKRINEMCNHLTILRQRIELNPAEANLNELIVSTLASLNGWRASFRKNLNPLPRLLVDAGQIQKVVTNLILNANEAVGDDGEIRVTTEQRDRWAVFSVSDSGCGMSKEFIEKSLFHPFKTTKKQGMGIGLFHSKMIVEAHQGRIEVESEEGRGSTFRVFLPINKV
jgi:putative PEP-CTERM system histidine kinase